MDRLMRTLLFGAVACALGAAAAWSLLREQARELPPAPIIVERVREVARLETLEISLHEAVRFTPDPKARDTLMGTVLEYAKFTLLPRDGTVIVFATARIGLDLSKLDLRHVRVNGEVVEVTLPPLRTTIELEPDKTLVVDSNLTTEQTMELLDLAKKRFAAKQQLDPQLEARARASAERSIQALLITLGFKEIRFVPVRPVANAG